MRRELLFLVAIAFLDLFVKFWVLKTGVENTKNAGFAWGIGGDWGTGLSWIVYIGAIGMTIYLARFYLEQGVVSGLLYGGMVGNFIDRFMDGEVTDFIKIGYWPWFNVADMAIVLGLMIVGLKWATRDIGRDK